MVFLSYINHFFIMELTEWANAFVGSTYFSILMILFIIEIGLLLRLTFTRHNDDVYRHKPDE